ncbi:NrsF family protein [Microvirga sp. G4-2]|uniref:NrsF family protein n=1 Tax=Microvirga sp. G4-2 TaxID=3434467 RepID=UPI00404441B6
METDGLIHQLAADATPVHPLASPWKRTGLWLAMAIPYDAFVVILMSPRPDLAMLLADPRFQVEQVAALATAILAAAAAFACTVPGRSRAICLLPIVPLAIWLASLGYGCLQDWRALGPEGLRLRIDWDCLPAASLVGIVPAIAMVVMLRRGAPLFPRVTLALAGLAVGALAQAGMQIYHVGDISLMVLVWHLGSVAALAAVAGWIGRRVLRWPDPTGLLRRSAPH